MKEKPLSTSKRLVEALNSIDIYDKEDVIRHLPRRYDEFYYTPKKYTYADKEILVKKGKVCGKVAKVRFSHRDLVTFYLETDERETILVEAWNRDYLLSWLKNGEEIITVKGNWNARNHALTMVSVQKGIIPQEEALKPIYSLPRSIANHVYCSLVERTFRDIGDRWSDLLPKEFLERYRLLSSIEALKKAHKPKDFEDIHQALRRLKYEEALGYALKNQIVRGYNAKLKRSSSKPLDREQIRAFVKSLPYHLTNSQKQAIAECLLDMEGEKMMYRLLQGDVGTGKTLVAEILCYANYTRNKQSAIMAPTDSLARQHYENFKAIFEGTDVKVGLLVGAMDASEKANVVEDIADGSLDIIVGTHALFSKGVDYPSLGLVIIDEQHKFGVNQRGALLGKGDNADLLLMSATPIPRTLSMTLFGDMDISTLTEFPSRKREVKTSIISPDNSTLIERIQTSIDGGHRVYIVVPQIEDRGDERTSVKAIFDRYKRVFPNKTVMMHGKMAEEEKNVSLLAFKTGLCPILVATSLIEVGIDVKEANLMVVYEPTHFALSSLHQLRGRIGRDGSKAEFIMLSDDDDEEEIDKLKVLTRSEDGFVIAEEDLKRRGPGEIAGVRQSGLPEFSYLNIIDDVRVFECARDDAKKMLQSTKNPDYVPFLNEIKALMEE